MELRTEISILKAENAEWVKARHRFIESIFSAIIDLPTTTQKYF